MGVELTDSLILLDSVAGDSEETFSMVCTKEEPVKWNETWNARDGSVFATEDKVFEEETTDCDDPNATWDASDVAAMLVCEASG